MNGMLKVVAVAYLAVAVWVGVGPLLPRATNVGSVALPSPGPSPVVLPSGGTLAGGSYYVDADPAIAPARFTFTVPAGWVSSNGGVKSDTPGFPVAGWQGEVEVETWMLTHVFSDACHWSTADLVAAGTTVDQLTTALLGQRVLIASGPTDVTIIPATPASTSSWSSRPTSTSRRARRATSVSGLVPVRTCPPACAAPTVPA